MGERREKGTGSITQRKDGRWVGRFDIGINDNGTRHIKYVYGKSEREAKRKLQELIRSVHAGEIENIQRMIVRDFMDDWLHNVKRNDLKPTSYDRLEATLEADVYPYIGNYQVHSIDGDDITKMLTSLKNAGRSHSTISKAYKAVNACFNYRLAQGKVTKNPCVGIKIPSKKNFKKKEIVFYTKEEAASLTKTALSNWSNDKPKYPLGAFVPLVLNTGLRAGELLALQWERDVDLESKTITVRQNVVMTKDRAKGAEHKFKLIEQDTVKTDAGQGRVIDLNDAAYDALCQLQVKTGQYTWVMTSRNGTRIMPRQLDQMFRRIETAAGLPEEKIYGVHALRHTFATLLLYNGVDVKIVSELMGHSDTAITYNTYIHVIQEVKRKAVRAIPKLI